MDWSSSVAVTWLEAAAGISTVYFGDEVSWLAVVDEAMMSAKADVEWLVSVAEEISAASAVELAWASSSLARKSAAW